MKFKILFICAFLLVSISNIFADKSILYISDSVHVSDSFNTKYMDMLQSLIDDDYGKGEIKIRKISKFDMNTTQCIELCDALYNQKHQDTVVLMVGDSNYHNLYGFSSYINSINKDKTIVIKQPRNVYEINNEMLKLYASTKKNTLTKLVSEVYNSLVGSGTGMTFVPEVVPNFYALNNSFNIDNNILATVETSRHAWKLIKEKKYEEAKIFLNSILEKKPSQSMLYYALGSAYLEENKEGCELKALQCFEDGILVDPLNKDNVCYKGLVLLYMMYKGKITAEVLYFARGLSKLITFPSEELEAIMTINTVDYDEKIKTINNWILSDIQKLINKAIKSNTNLIFTSYPDDIPVNSLIFNYVKDSSRVLYIDNKSNMEEKLDFIIYRMAKKMYDFLKEKNIIR